MQRGRPFDRPRSNLTAVAAAVSERESDLLHQTDLYVTSQGHIVR